MNFKGGMDMTYIYQFWHSLRNPASLSYLLKKEEEHGNLQGYKKTVFIVLLFAVFLFVLRDTWGMYTERLTEIFGQGLLDRYIFARYISIIGSILFGTLYFLFHYYVVTYFISLLTDLPYKWIQKVQLYVLASLLLFNFLEFLIFAAIQYVPIFSPFSLAAIAAQFTSSLWALYFFNQIAFPTFITIVIQYTFLEQWIGDGRKTLLLILISLQILIAVIVATVSISPLIEWIGRGLS